MTPECPKSVSRRTPASGDAFAAAQGAGRAQPGEGATNAHCVGPAGRAFPGEDSQDAPLGAKCTCAPAAACVIPVISTARDAGRSARDADGFQAERCLLPSRHKLKVSVSRKPATKCWGRPARAPWRGAVHGAAANLRLIPEREGVRHRAPDRHWAGSCPSLAGATGGLHWQAPRAGTTADATGSTGAGRKRRSSRVVR
jgi:hypothetical protein